MKMKTLPERPLMLIGRKEEKRWLFIIRHREIRKKREKISYIKII